MGFWRDSTACAVPEFLVAPKKVNGGKSAKTHYHRRRSQALGTATSDDEDLILTVEDNGPGISSEQAQHIGEPFYRGDSSRTRDTGGTGLGIYLATLVAEAQGGTLRLTNPGRSGARFECRIPLAFNITS